MISRQTRFQVKFPWLWLLSDARNDAALETALARLPRGSGFIFRHYHLAPADRRRRFAQLARIARKYGHTVILSGAGATAARWGADGFYGPPLAARARPGRRLLALVTAHSLRELALANRAGANGVLLSPVFPTRSHPGGKNIGPVRFGLLARRAKGRVIALGGMNRKTARRLGQRRWAAIDGLA